MYSLIFFFVESLFLIPLRGEGDVLLGIGRLSSFLVLAAFLAISILLSFGILLQRSFALLDWIFLLSSECFEMKNEGFPFLKTNLFKIE